MRVYVCGFVGSGTSDKILKPKTPFPFLRMPNGFRIYGSEFRGLWALQLRQNSESVNPRTVVEFKSRKTKSTELKHTDIHFPVTSTICFQISLRWFNYS